MEALLPGDVVGAWASVILPFAGPGRVALADLGQQLSLLVEADVAGLFAADGSGELGKLDAAEALAVGREIREVGARAGLPVVLDGTAPSLAEAIERIAAGRELRPAAWSVRPPDASAGGRADAELSALARAAAPATLILEEPGRGAFDGATLVAWSAALPQIVGARIQPRDGEGWAQLAPAAEELALFAAGREWASGSRWGARSSASELVALAPGAAVAFADLVADEVQRALRLELRFLRFLEAHVLPLLRRSPRADPSPGRLLALAGGWCPGLQSGPDGRILLTPEQVRELGRGARRLLGEFDARSGSAGGAALG